MTHPLSLNQQEWDESGLAQFRAANLTPDKLLDALDYDNRLLLRIPLGVGKTHAIDAMLDHPKTYQHYPLVVYVAPAWNIINERQDPPGIRVERLTGRDGSRCGQLDRAWSQHETMGRSALAKEKLCKTCPNNTETNPCPWLNRFKCDNLKGTQLIFTVEANFLANPSYLELLKRASGVDNALVILDEAKILDQTFEVKLQRQDLRNFNQAILGAKGIDKAIASSWATSIDRMLAAEQPDIEERNWDFPRTLNRQAAAIQEAGVNLIGADFNYIGYDLLQFAWSRSQERVADPGQPITFIARPHFGDDDALLIASANMSAKYAANRLGLDTIASPFENVRFRHTGTRIFNLKTRATTKRHFPGNASRVLNFFAVLIRHNIDQGMSTVLVSKKAFKDTCINYLTKRLAGWGYQVQFSTGTFPKTAVPTEIPVIHYGMAGINALEQYDACYCLNAFYTSDEILTAQLYAAEPEGFKVKLTHGTDVNSNRYVEVADPRYHLTDLNQWLAQTVFEKLEVDPVLQAAGRVRFFTKPREVIVTTMHDLEPYVGEVRDIRSLSEAYRVLDIPKIGAKDPDTRAKMVVNLRGQGKSIREVAALTGIPKTTVGRILAEDSG